METKLCIWSSYYYGLSTEEAIERFIKNGIYATELSDEHGFELLQRSDDVVATGKELKRFIDERDFEISQGHLWLGARLCEEGALEIIYKWIDMYEAIGIKNMVLHCDNLIESDFSRETKIEMNIEKLKLIADYIKGKDITICLENLRKLVPEQKHLIDQNADDLIYIIDRVGSDKFGICLDTGHLNMTEKGHYDFILKAGKRLKALHIADNEGYSDQHLMPFTNGNVKFSEVIKGLREVGYKGMFNLEIPGENKVPMELRDAKISYIKACYEYLMR